MDFLKNRRVQIGGGVGLAISLLILHGIEIGRYSQPLSLYVPTLTSLLNGFTYGLIAAGGFYLLRGLIKKYGKIALYASPLILVLLGDVIARNSLLSAFTSPIAGIIGFIGGVALIVFLMFKAKLITVTPKTIAAQSDDKSYEKTTKKI